MDKIQKGQAIPDFMGTRWTPTIYGNFIYLSIQYGCPTGEKQAEHDCTSCCFLWFFTLNHRRSVNNNHTIGKLLCRKCNNLWSMIYFILLSQSASLCSNILWKLLRARRLLVQKDRKKNFTSQLVCVKKIFYYWVGNLGSV